MNLDDRLSQLVRGAIEPMLAEHLGHLEQRLAERLDGLGQRPVRETAPSLMTLRELASYLRLSPRTVQRMAAENELPPPVRITRGRPRWRRADVDAWLDSRETGNS